MTHILHNSQPSRGCDRNTFEVMTIVHPPNRFEHNKEYGMIIFVPTKKKKWHEQRHDRIFFKVE
jgi:hypothetical protein